MGRLALLFVLCISELLSAQTWAPAWPSLLGPEEPCHPDTERRADEFSPWLIGGLGDELRVAFVGTRYGSLDVFAQRVYGVGRIVRSPLLRPHQDRGAFRQANPMLGTGSSGFWWVVWSDDRRGSGQDLLIRSYFGDSAQAREFAVSELDLADRRREARAVVELPPDRVLVAWREEGAEGVFLKARVLGIFGTEIFPEQIIREPGEGEARDLTIRRVGNSIAARAFWIDTLTGEPALLTAPLDGTGNPSGSPLFLRRDVRAFDVVWDGEAWFLATLIDSPSRTGRADLVVERIAADLSEVLLPPTRLSRTRADRVSLAREGERLLLGEWEESETRSRPRAWLSSLAEPTRFRRLRLPREASGPLRPASSPGVLALAWQEGRSPARRLVVARLEEGERRLAPWNAIEDPGAADQRIGCLGRTPEGEAFCVYSTVLGTEPELFLGRGRSVEPIALGRRGRSARDPELATGPDGRHLVTWREERAGRSAVACARWLEPDGTPRGGVLRLDRSRSDPAAGRTLPWIGEDGVWFLRDVRDEFGAELVLEIRDARGRKRLERHVLASSAADDTLRAGSLFATTTGFVATWHAGPEGSEEIFWRALEADGSPSGPARIASATAGAHSPRGAARDGGGFALAWVERRGALSDVRWVVHDSNLAPLAPPALVTDGGAGEQDQVVIARVPGRGFAVCWEDDSGGHDAIHLRTFDGDGVPLSGVYRVHENIGGVIPDRVEPRLLVDGERAWIGWMDRRRSRGFDVYLTAADLGAF